MQTYNFYISNKQINEQAKESSRGFWKEAGKVGAIVYTLFILLIATTVLLSIFVSPWLAIPLGIFCFVFFALLDFGFNKFCFGLAKQENANTKYLFAGFSKKAGSVLAIAFKRLLLSLIWLVMLVVPCIIKNIGYSMSILLLCDRQDINGDNALNESKHIMMQNYGRYFKFILSNILWLLLALITAGIAWIWVGPKLTVKKAIFYENLKTEF